jgi:type II secretory pathway pseudopilin PulG
MDMERRRETAMEVDPEAGFMLIAVVVMVALVLLALAVAAPVVAKDLRRDKEVESQHRMEQYVRAIQLYQRKFPGQYPASIKALEQTNNIRFLRRQWVDPLTGKADWRLIHQGEQQTKIHVFFGQELAGLSASLGAAAGMVSPGQTGAAGTSSSNCVSAGGLAAGFNGACQTSTTGGAGATGGTGASGATGSTGSAFGDGTGGIIVGVGTARTGPSITEPNGQDTYEKWEFWYDPRIELLRKAVSLTGGGMGSTDVGSFGASGATGGTGATGSAGTTGTPAANPFAGGGFGSTGP